MDGGFIKMHRQIQDTWIWDNPKFLKWWIDLLFMANFDERQIIVGFKPMKLKRGQLRASVSFLMERWEYKNRNNIINFLKLLEQDGMIKRETIGNTTIITICNYTKYQDRGTKGSNHTDTTLVTALVTAPDTTLVTQEEELKKVRTQDNNITPHTNNACARIEKDEEAYYTEAKSSGEFLEHLQRKFRIFDVTRFSNLLDEYHKECKGLDIRHTSHKDFRQKFEWWAADKVQGVFPTEQVVNNLIEADGKQAGWQLIEHYKSYFDLVRKANLTNYIYKLDILRPWQYDDLVMVRGFTPQEIWDSTLELDNNEQYCRNHKNAYSCLITFCDYNKRRR